jgi:hypothetical protein
MIAMEQKALPGKGANTPEGREWGKRNYLIPIVKHKEEDTRNVFLTTLN